MEKINKSLTNGKTEKNKLSSGYEELDTIIHSFEKSNLYVLAGRPGMGKTALGLNIVYNLAYNQNKSVVVFSYEMTERQIINRLLAIFSGIENQKILINDLSKEENLKLLEGENAFKNTEIYLDCPGTMDFNGIRTKLANLMVNTKVDLLLIDDIQRITISDKDRQYAANREQEVSKNVRDLKALAKELNIPILAISQVNRNSKDRPSIRPILTDIRDSGAIENDSDVVLFLHRPEYYGITQDEEGNSLLKIAEIEIAKNRHGQIGKFRLIFEQNTPCFLPFKDEFFSPDFRSNSEDFLKDGAMF